MADTSFHRLTIASIADTLVSLRAILHKAEDHAKANNIDFAALMQASLYPDMYNLLQQLQYACYVPADFAQHFSDAPAPHVGYDEANLADCLASIDTTIAYLKAIPQARLAERAGNIVPTFFDPEQGMTAVDYAAAVTLPDFHFHVTVAYAILRHKGVPLNKGDFFGEVKTVAIAKT